jgi:hypothetical protein
LEADFQVVKLFAYAQKEHINVFVWSQSVKAFAFVKSIFWNDDFIYQQNQLCCC